MIKCPTCGNTSKINFLFSRPRNTAYQCLYCGRLFDIGLDGRVLTWEEINAFMREEEENEPDRKPDGYENTEKYQTKAEKMMDVSCAEALRIQNYGHNK